MTLAGSVTVDSAGAATGSGMALALYFVLATQPSYANLDTLPGMDTARIVAALRQLAETCNAFATIADGPQWIITGNITTTYSANIWEFVRANPTSGPFTVSLPAANSSTFGKCVIVKNTSSSTNAITVNITGGGSFIDNTSTDTMNTALAMRYYVSAVSGQWYVGKM